MATYVIKANVGQELGRGATSDPFVAEAQTVLTDLVVVINASLDRSAVTKTLRKMAERLCESDTPEPPAAYT